MSTTDRLLNRCKSVLSIDSDYRLAKVLGISHTTITHWRNGRSTPSDEAVISICALMQKDPAQAIAQLHAERAKTDVARAFWQNAADRLSRAVAPVMGALFAAIVLIALSPTPAQASEGNTVRSYSTPLCIMLNGTHSSNAPVVGAKWSTHAAPFGACAVGLKNLPPQTCFPRRESP